MNPKSFHVCKSLISMVTWANRLMFYTTYMHQHINLLLNKAANLCLYDQTCYWWMLATQPVVTHEKHPEIQRHLRCTLEWWIQPAGQSEAQVPQSGPSKSQLRSCRNKADHRLWLPPMLQLIPLNLCLKLFHWTLCCTQHVGDIFTFLHGVCRPVYQSKIFLIKIMTDPCHVVSRYGNHRPCHSDHCVHEEH